MVRQFQHFHHAHQALHERDQMLHRQQLHLQHLAFHVGQELWLLVRDLYQGEPQLQSHVLHRLQPHEDQSLHLQLRKPIRLTHLIRFQF